MTDKAITAIFREIGDRTKQRFDEIFSTHPQLREVPEKTEIRTKQCNEGCEYSVWFDGEQIARFTISSETKSYTETLVKISEITYFK